VVAVVGEGAADQTSDAVVVFDQEQPFGGVDVPMMPGRWLVSSTPRARHHGDVTKALDVVP
jgi:hypothetical protein